MLFPVKKLFRPLLLSSSFQFHINCSYKSECVLLFMENKDQQAKHCHTLTTFLPINHGTVHGAVFVNNTPHPSYCYCSREYHEMYCFVMLSLQHKKLQCQPIYDCSVQSSHRHTDIYDCCVKSSHRNTNVCDCSIQMSHRHTNVYD